MQIPSVPLRRNVSDLKVRVRVWMCERNSSIGDVRSFLCDRHHKIWYSCITVSPRVLNTTSNIFIWKIEYPLSQASNIIFLVSIFLPINSTSILERKSVIQKWTANSTFSRAASIEGRFVRIFSSSIQTECFRRCGEVQILILNGRLI